jgi:hypothetical protein
VHQQHLNQHVHHHQQQQQQQQQQQLHHQHSMHMDKDAAQRGRIPRIDLAAVRFHHE